MSATSPTSRPGRPGATWPPSSTWPLGASSAGPWPINAHRAGRHALTMAFEHRAPEQGLVFHSDRGGQYTSRDFGRAGPNQRRRALGRSQGRAATANWTRLSPTSPSTATTTMSNSPPSRPPSTTMPPFHARAAPSERTSASFPSAWPTGGENSWPRANTRAVATKWLSSTSNSTGTGQPTHSSTPTGAGIAADHPFRTQLVYSPGPD